MWPTHLHSDVDPEVPTSLTGRASAIAARNRLTAQILEVARERESRAVASLPALRGVVDEVLAQDPRFPFHLAAWVSERMGQRRLGVALLVEAANRMRDCRRSAGRPGAPPFSLRPLVGRVVTRASDAAYAMAYQVHHFGWSMPGGLRTALNEVLEHERVRGGQEAAVEDGEVALSVAARPALRAAAAGGRWHMSPGRAALAAH